MISMLGARIDKQDILWEDQTFEVEVCANSAMVSIIIKNRYDHSKDNFENISFDLEKYPNTVKALEELRKSNDS